jgi:general secretion pathway protein K
MMRRARRGVALMLALWLIVVLGGVAAGVATATRSQSTVMLTARSRATAQYATESGVVAATGGLRELLAESATPESRVLAFSDLDERFASLRDVDVGNGRFSVTVIDVGARIDLNNAPEETVRGLLRQFVHGQDPTSLAAALQDWKDADDIARRGGAEAEDYRRAASPFVPTNRPLSRLDELTRVAGFSDSLALALAPYVTVDGGLKVNVNSAPEPVLAAIRDVGPAGARALVARREADGAFPTLGALTEAMRGGPLGPTAWMQLDVLPSRLLVVSRGWERGRPLTHEIQAVYELRESELVLRSWRERDL